MKRPFLCLAFLVLLAAMIRIPLLNIPFERDEGEYAYIGWRLDHGELPYRDWVDQKPPGVFWVYRAALHLAMDSIRAVHFMAFLASAISACALFLLARRLLKEFWAWIAAALFILLSADPGIQGTAANTELFMLPPLILAQLAFLAAVGNDPPKIRYALLSGLLTGLAIAFKQVAVVNWPFLVIVCPLFLTGKDQVRQTVSFAIWSAVGVALVWGWIAVYFLLRHGFQEFLYNVFVHNFEYINSTPFSVRWINCLATLEKLSHSQAVVWVLALVGYLALVRTGKFALLLFLAGWLVASFIGVSASGFYFPHYFQQLLPPLCVAAAFAGEELAGANFWKPVPAVFRSAACVLVLAALPASSLKPYLFNYTPTQAVEHIYPGCGFGEMPEVGRRVAQLTRPDDRVFIFGADPEVLFYAGRVSATRYIFLFPLYGPYRDAREKQIAATKEITASRPAVVLYSPNEWFYRMGSEKLLTQWTRSYVQNNFLVNSYLTLDRDKAVHLVPVASDPKLVFGALYVRRAK